MPYIVTTKRPGTKWLDVDPAIPIRRDPPVVSRRAVATLEEARRTCLGVLDAARLHGSPLAVYRAAVDLPESGGTVGPLPDGTVIGVEPIRSDGPDPRRAACPLIFTSDWLAMSERERCDAFNAREKTA